MKNLINIFGVILLLLIIQSCKKDNSSLPILTTTAVSNITETSAQSGGNITNAGNADIISRGLVWGKNQSPTIETNSGFSNNGVGLGLFQTDLTGLEGNTTYYVRAFASNKVGTEYGNQQDFKTQLIEKPFIKTSTAKNISKNSAIIGGEILGDGGSPITERGVYWSTSQNPETTGAKVKVDSDALTFYYNLDDLSINTTYFVKAYAKNIKGETLGDQISFTTLPLFPLVTTTLPSVIASFFSIATGNVTYDGGGTISERGVFFGKYQNPELTGTKIVSGSGIGVFTAQLTDLSENTSYYIKSYAINAAGIGYSDQITFTTNTTIKDIENNSYGMVKIGVSWWLTENLKTKKYNNGDDILTTTPAIKDITGESAPKYQWAYDSSEANVAVYGRLYTAFVISDSRGICPTGWHVATSADWNTLVVLLGGASVAGGKLKESGTMHWKNPNGGATNEYGFSALPSGFRADHGYFANINQVVDYYSGDESSSTSNWIYEIGFNYGTLGISNTTKKYGLPIRCVKN